MHLLRDPNTRTTRSRPRLCFIHGSIIFHYYFHHSIHLNTGSIHGWLVQSKSSSTLREGFAPVVMPSSGGVKRPYRDRPGTVAQREIEEYQDTRLGGAITSEMVCCHFNSLHPKFITVSGILRISIISTV